MCPDEGSVSADSPVSRDIAEYERQFREILEHCPAGVNVVDEDGRLLFHNARVRELFGYSKEELLRMNAADIEDPASGETTMRLQLGRVRGGGRYETKHRRKDGTLFDVEVSVGLLENGKLEAHGYDARTVVGVG